MSGVWQRWIPLTGIVFVVLFLVVVMIGFGPDTSKSDEYLLNWFSDSGHQTTQVVEAYLLGLAGVAFLLFMHRLRSTVAAAEGTDQRFAPIIWAGAIVFTAGLAVMAASSTAIAIGSKYGGADVTNADLIRTFPQLGFVALLVGGGLALTLAVLATAVASFRLAIFPTWFNWLTVLCGISLLFALAFVPLLVLAIWIVAGSLVLMGSPTDPRPASA